MVLPPVGRDLAVFKSNKKYLDSCFVGAQLIDPQTAVKASFLDEVVAADKLMTRAMEKARDMQKLDGKAYAGNKKLVRGPLTQKMLAELEAGKGLSVSA